MPRLIAYPLLVVAGILSLPVAATFLDGQGTENWILPAQLSGMAVIGGLVGLATPALAGERATTERRVVVGVVAGLVAALAGVVLFFLLLNGFEGA
jgi:hypothetical protein